MMYMHMMNTFTDGTYYSCQFQATPFFRMTNSWQRNESNLLILPLFIAEKLFVIFFQTIAFIQNLYVANLHKTHTFNFEMHYRAAIF